jgi:CTP:molybdopterin cytidylyltransferase MocA
VLAAGAAARMEGRTKALVERDGVPIVRRVATSLIEASIRDVVVVLGHRAEAVAAALEGLPVTCTVNADFADGHASSLRAGLSALPGHLDTIAIALADQPLLEASDVRDLLTAFARRGAARVVVPRVRRTRGHPVVLEAGVGREILQRAAGFGVRDWLQEHPGGLAWMDSGNDHYCVDLDSPADLALVARRYGCTLRWPAE